MIPEEYNEFINEFVKNWYNITGLQKKSFQKWVNYFKDKPFSFLNILPFRYFPEPYIGNPLSEKLKAVFINLNPGSGGDMQDVFKKHDALSILKLFKNKRRNYHETIKEFIQKNECFFENNKKFFGQKLLKNKLNKYKEKYGVSELKPLHDTYAWWHDNRLLWLQDILGSEETPSLNDIIGVELTPWHSTNFAEMGNTASENNIWQYVLKPCIELSKKLEEGPFRKGSKSIVISKGSALKHVLSKKKLEKLSEEFPELKMNLNPIVELTNHTNWYLWKFSCPETQWQCFFLVYTKKGFDMKIEKGKKVKNMLQEILSSNA
jgi:hypothetical protein